MNLSFLSATNLFHGIREDELEALLPCLNAHERRFRKDEVIYRAGDTVTVAVTSSDMQVRVSFLRKPTPPFRARSCW